MAFDPEKPDVEHVDLYSRQSSDNDSGPKKISNYVKLRNPLAGLTREELLDDVNAFAMEKGLEDKIELLRNGGGITLIRHTITGD